MIYMKALGKMKEGAFIQLLVSVITVKKKKKGLYVSSDQNRPTEQNGHSSWASAGGSKVQTHPTTGRRRA